MIHPIPPGTRDVLPDEMRELRRLSLALVEVFERHGFREVRTPAIEYAEVMEMADGEAAGSAYRFFDDTGQLLSLRTEMTVPIARLVATRFGELEPPYRLSYLGNAYMAVTPQRGQMREFGHAGVELIGVPGAAGTAEVIAVLEDSLAAAGLTRSVIGLGDADMWAQLVAELGVAGERAEAVLARLAGRDLVGLEACLRELDELAEGDVATLLELTQLRGGPEVLDRARSLGGAAVERAVGRIEQTHRALAERGAAERVQIDLGLLRDLGYYSGSILEVYDPSLGQIVGGGGRYDNLMSRFGLDLPAAGFSLYLERLHMAMAEQERRDAGTGAKR